MAHHHADNQCCSTDKKVQTEEHEHAISFTQPLIAFLLLMVGIALDQWIKPPFFQGYIRLFYYLIPYALVGLEVIKDAWLSIRRGDVFSEFFLMSIATIGAFTLGEYPEGVAVMLFYAVGEVFQSMAVAKAKGNIKSLLDQRPDTVSLEDGTTIPAKKVALNTTLLLKAGEKLALDGVLLSNTATFNTAALTGESKPNTKYKDQEVLAGMINLNQVSLVKVTRLYEDSKLSKILNLVQNATAQKAPTELFIRKFAKIYTPIVVYLALAICLVPYFFDPNYEFSNWLYRALIFLVISCPCALVVSIPLGYFGGIGAASRNGILVKGSNYLDTLTQLKSVVMDKTGTLTEGVFEVQSVHLSEKYPDALYWINEIEKNSTHPVATAINNYVKNQGPEIELSQIEEIAGHGLKAHLNQKTLLVGNAKLLKKFNIEFSVPNIPFTQILAAYDNEFIGYITIADRIKSSARESISQLHALGVQPSMLSGDKKEVVEAVAHELGISQAWGDLLPEDKVDHFKTIKAKNSPAAFVGDGVNDAPVIALSDVGIAMGGLGSDAAIETANVVIQDDDPLKIPMAIRIGKATKRIVWQNIALAFGVKAIVLLLGAGGVATMWEAVFADVGVAFLAILNAIRIQRMKF